ncbi:GNAT family N-acetyltransferase [Acuticoccus sediminis]|uniref:GNAT family N-acetyltransferase n=1 Tax=Acuticoccus sediminis TaxID=2184697 RepID=A0A8B2NNB9_9HYPH|nr:GNAT family N-acetyltransferase [Acuticoccus sediminis]RAH98149.1 GNAT family N-acetyltransferase [Acuticoccus sediminis]
MPTMTVEATGSLETVDKQQWDDLANPGWIVEDGGRVSGGGSHAFNPFVTYDFLRALEDAGCVGGRSGWYPRHLLIRGAEGSLIGAAPAYLKTHSKGEYVFDYGWADAFERAGGRYYPKLQVSVPFTPAQGPRLLVGEGSAEARQLVGRALVALADEVDASSIHATFLQSDDVAALQAEDYLLRTDTQFHFTNDGYETPDDFLAALASRKRKQVKRERRDALANDISIRWLTGDDITEAHWDAFYEFYMDTGSRKWGRPYLNRKFFSLLGERLGHCVCLMIAERAGRPIAGALNLIGSDTLFGRYWGCTEDHPFLHFEVCYYQAIDFAIAHKLKRVEAGAQGGHKLARGYEPTQTVSAHYIGHPGLRTAVAHYLEAERREVEAHQSYLNQALPFRKGDDPTC